MEQVETKPATAAELKAYRAWWAGLSESWKKAYNEVMSRQSSTDMPSAEVLHQIWTSPALRFAGPTAPYPNMSFELEDLDGVLGLKNLEIFVFTFQKIDSIKAIAQLPQLKSLFVFNNQLKSIDGVEALANLQEFYFQVNEVDSLGPLKHLTQLHTIYCSDNHLSSLYGIGKQHAGTLKKFHCLPNDGLTDETVMRFEQENFIRCLKG